MENSVDFIMLYYFFYCIKLIKTHLFSKWFNVCKAFTKISYAILFYTFTLFLKNKNKLLKHQFTNIKTSAYNARKSLFEWRENNDTSNKLQKPSSIEHLLCIKNYFTVTSIIHICCPGIYFYLKPRWGVSHICII